jgi:heme/copper-type cytochrome/quinol oxidase subunit 2
MLSMWSATLYFLMALFFLRMRARKNLDRPISVRYGQPLAVFLLVYTALIALGITVLDWHAAAAWVALVAVVVLYDHFVVPRTKRGGFYRQQILRQRTSAARLE